MSFIKLVFLTLLLLATSFLEEASATPICGRNNGHTFTGGGPPSEGNCQENGSPVGATIFGARMQGGYWTGWKWSCGGAACDATLAPGKCGTANGTTVWSAPSTPSELCKSGSLGWHGVVGNGPWTWSCTGTPCKAERDPSLFDSTEGNNEGFFVVRTKDKTTGSVVSAGIFDRAPDVGNPNATPVVSTGEGVLVDFYNSSGPFKTETFLLSDIWNVGVSGRTRIQGDFGDGSPLSGEPSEKLVLVFGCFVQRTVNTGNSSWKEGYSGICMKMFTEENGTLESKTKMVFQDGTSLGTGVASGQKCRGAYNPKVAGAIRQYVTGSRPPFLYDTYYVVFNGVCGKEDGQQTGSGDVGQSLLVVPVDATGIPPPNSPPFLFVEMSEKTTWNGFESEFGEMPWNWTLGTDGIGGVNLTVFLPEFLMTARLTYCVHRCGSSPEFPPHATFAEIKTVVH